MSGELISGFMQDTTLFLLTHYVDGVYLESLNFEPGYKDVDSAFEYRLDRKITEKDVSISYAPGIKQSTITMPYPLNAPPVCVSANAPAGYMFTNVEEDGQIPATQFKVKGDARAQGLFIGIPFESSYTFSPFAIRDQNNGGNAIMSGRLQLRSLSLSCSDTGYLNIHVTPQFRDTSSYCFTARELGHGSNIIGASSLYTGLIKVPLLSLNTQVSVTVNSVSFYPFALVNATWEGFYNSRSQRT